MLLLIYSVNDLKNLVVTILNSWNKVGDINLGVGQLALELISDFLWHGLWSGQQPWELNLERVWNDFVAWVNKWVSVIISGPDIVFSWLGNKTIWSCDVKNDLQFAWFCNVQNISIALNVFVNFILSLKRKKKEVIIHVEPLRIADYLSIQWKFMLTCYSLSWWH